MSRPFMEILKLIEAHFNNNDDDFNTYARAIADFYAKEGNTEGADEIYELIKTGHIKPRTNTPGLFKEIETNGYAFSSKTLSTNIEPNSSIDSSKTKQDSSIITEPYKGNNENKVAESIDSIVPKKRHRRTKAELEALKVKETMDIKDKPKRHRRTKVELEQAGFYKSKTDKSISNNKNDAKQVKPSINTEVTKKRHRRTKAELMAAGYYDN